MNSQLDAFLGTFSREAREISLCLRILILNIFPRAVESIDSKSGIIAYSYRKDSKDFLFAIAPHMKHVNLMFSTGYQIPDPSGVMSGTGKQARHVKIRSEAETENPNLRQLILEALKLEFENTPGF